MKGQPWPTSYDQICKRFIQGWRKHRAPSEDGESLFSCFFLHFEDTLHHENIKRQLANTE